MFDLGRQINHASVGHVKLLSAFGFDHRFPEGHNRNVSTLRQIARDALQGVTSEQRLFEILEGAHFNRQISELVEGQIKLLKQLEILKLISEGLSQKMIAEKLDIGHNTVREHTQMIYRKLQVPNAPAAVAKAIKTNIL